MTIERGIFFVFFMLASLWAAPADAIPGGVELTDYTHTQWTAASGAPAGIGSMAQTADGWLWLGTADGLYRFDGLRFERYRLPSRLGLNRDRINQLVAAPNGDLYITYFAEGFSVLHPDGRVEQMPSPPAARNGIGALTVDHDGSLWVVAGNLQHFKNGGWRIAEAGDDWASSRGVSMLLDQRGQLWAGNDRGVWRLDRASGRFARILEGGGQLLLAPDGSLWQARDADSVRKVSEAGGRRQAGHAQATSMSVGLFDHDGALWLFDCGAPLCRRRMDGGMQRLGEARQLSGGEAQAILEDREGNIWVSTENGIDRFRPNRLLSSGLPGSGVRYSLASDGAGGMWAADIGSGALWRLAANAMPVKQARPPVTLVANGRDGAVFVGDKRAIERIAPEGKQIIPLPPGPDGKPRDHHMLGILDDGKVLWTATMETGLIGWRDGKWLPHSAFNLPPKIFQSGPAGIGQLWLATGDGTLVFYDDGKLTTYDIRQLGMASCVFPGGEPIVSGADGTGILKNGKLRIWRGADPDILRSISGLAVTRDGDRWLNGAAGLIHVRADDWKRAIDDPDQPLRYEVFGAADGYPGRAVIETRWPGIMSPDGRNLWMLATGGVVRLDTATLRRNRAVPRPVILSVATDQKVYPANGPVRLPPANGRFRFDFTAPALRAPEGLRFEYRLDGVDPGWIAAGSRRSTSYTNVGAGDYTFRLRVFNEDGVAGDGEISLPLTVEPTLAENPWFRGFCVLAAMLLAFALYRYRIRYLTRRMAERLEVRVAERDRIAMELHDTVLQSMHGVIMHAESAADKLTNHPEAKDKLDRVIKHANNAIIEGRERVQSLRHGSDDELIDMFDALVAREGGAVPIEVAQHGVSRALHLVIKDELYVIGREALRNALRHAQAGRIALSLTYAARELVLEVGDDGVGIPDGILAAGGRAGHMGLAAMRHRAEQIGGRCTLESRPGATVVRVAVPARLAYLVAA